MTQENPETPDLQQAIHGDGHAKTLRGMAYLAAGITDVQMDACLAGADALEQLQAAQAENQQLRELLQRARMFMRWPTFAASPKLVRLHNEIRAALEQQAAPRQDNHDEATIAAEPITEADRDLVRKATTTDLTSAEMLPAFEEDER